MLTRSEARSIASSFNLPLDRDFHSLDSATVERVIAAADAHKYRQPRNANGSRARYFHTSLMRAANSTKDV